MFVTAVRTEPKTEGPAEKLQSLLSAFQSRVDGVRGVAIADKSDLPMCVLALSAWARVAIESPRPVGLNLGLARIEVERLGR